MGLTAEKVWELAYKLNFHSKAGGFDDSEMRDMFPNLTRTDVFNLSLQELEKYVNDYEESKKLKIGDIVLAKDLTKYIVLEIDEDVVTLLSENGCVENYQIDDSNLDLVRVTQTNLVTKLVSFLREMLIEIPF